MKIYVDSTFSEGVTIIIRPPHQLLVYVTDELLQMSASSLTESSTQRSHARPLLSASETPRRQLSWTWCCIKSANACVRADVEAVNATVLQRRAIAALLEGCKFVVSLAQHEGQQREPEKKKHVQLAGTCLDISLHSWSCTIKQRPRALSGYYTEESLAVGQLSRAPARTALQILALRSACMALHTRFPTNRRINGVRHRTWRFLPRIRYCISKQKTSVERLCEMVSMRNASPSTPEFDGRARNAYRRQDSFVLVQWQLHNEESVHS
ncbi:Hypothetical_protein [Hexamita inflata]|uniref:Hypothetical_protein n=1 Tax=Hexamita inflata TaxID=28002 RepID=A0AA86P511_9EUKA|nr:Hypothetical protein HINF_LOCUS18608 [Hexamita inflata]